jgi:hypothetical protein
MKFRSALLGLFIIFATAGWLDAAELDQQALAAWETYTTSAKLHTQERLAGNSPFLWVDEDPIRTRHLDSGEIVVEPIGKGNPISVPHGFVHHWIGAAFVPGATIQDLSDVVGDYSKYSEIYRPTLIKTELLDSNGDEQKISIIWLQRALLVTAAFYTELDSNYVTLNSRQGYMSIYATRVQQIEHYGQRDEQRLAPDEGSGYVWRLATFARFEERDNGLYLELEVVALSREFSGATRFLLQPLLSRLPRQLLLSKVEQTRQAIKSRANERLIHYEQTRVSSSQTHALTLNPH